MSKGLNVAERNYKVHDKELLSVIQGLEEWRHIFEGTKHMIEILNDHRSLMYFRTSQNLNCQQAHWSLWLVWFDLLSTGMTLNEARCPLPPSRPPDRRGGQLRPSDAISQTFLSKLSQDISQYLSDTLTL